jgi:MYXO-CTERM domain-containing protein
VPATSATGGAAPTTTAPATSDSGDEGGCSVSLGASPSTVASLGFLGLFGLLLLRLRKR